MEKLLSTEFLAKYPDMPEHMNEMAQFIFYRTYSRWLPDKKRRETWKEAVARAVEYNINLSIKEFKKNNLPFQIDKIKIEAETLFDNIFNLRQFLSGRTHWVGGADTGVAEKFPLANFNCAFINITEWNNLTELFYLLLVGTGVGIKCTKENAAKLPPIRTNFTLIHSDYKPLPKSERLEDTKLHIMDNGYAKIYIGDSKEGWVRALKMFLTILTNENYKDIHTIKISYNSIRPKGERLKTFGGTASGHKPMKIMFEGFEKVIKGHFAPIEVKDNYAKVRPIHILDMCNLIGTNVVVGGVRRTAEIFLCDADDWEVINAKKDLTKFPHRMMSNNSICFTEKPKREELNKIFQIIKKNGEPGFINLAAAKKRRPNAEGVNPCGEVLLDSHGVCNLTTVNVKAFVKEKDGVAILDYSGLMQAQALSVRAGIRMTLIDLELNEFNKIQKRDRLIGASLTGWKDAMELLGYDDKQEAQLLNLLAEVAHTEAIKYCHILRIPTPLLSTTIKPEGTLSQVANGVSSGLHYSFAPYYLRRIRINAHDPLAKVAAELGWMIEPEVGEDKNNPNTLVISFPVKSEALTSRDSISAKKQLENYINFQTNYTMHNSSNTIYVKEDEWDEVEQFVWDNWDNFIGVTFMPFDGGSYELAPYEAITEEEYAYFKSSMKPFNPDLLTKYESDETTVEILDECEAGVCPVR